jgi:ABC-type multidrug transport system ATPase subunit
VESVLRDLGLSDARHTIIGTIFRSGLSKGQLRRASVGVELLASPRVLLLDEPTSGLDAAAAYTMVSMLRKVSRQGRAVFATLHQPSSDSFHLLDKLCLMVRGEVVYFGPKGEAVTYFSRLGLECPQVGSGWRSVVSGC